MSNVAPEPTETAYSRSMPRPRPHVLQNCAPDAEYHEYDVWGEHDDGSREGCEDADAY